MKKLVILIGIILFSLSIFGQSPLSKRIKGNWETRDRVCIIVVPLTPDSLKWSIENYHFDISIKKFLWFRTYKVSGFYIDTLEVKHSFLANKGKYSINDDSSTINIAELRMENYKCNCLLDKSNVITYKVVWVNDNWMTWIPQNVPWYEASNQNRTVYWANRNVSYGIITKPPPSSFPRNIIPVAEKKNFH